MLLVLVYVDAGSTPTYTITPNSGYHISTIMANGESVVVTNPAGQSYTFAAISADGSLIATYAANGGTQYTVTVTQTDHGVIAPGGTTSYDAGATPSFTITPDQNYHIASVTTNAGAQALVSPYVFPALNANETLTATFDADTVQYNVVVTHTAHGTMAPLGYLVAYDAGSTPSFTITSNRGYHIAKCND